MSCERYDSLLDAYVDGARHAAFESHLAGCPRCQALVADFTSIRRTAAALEDQVPPPRVWARIASSIEEEQRRPRWARSLTTPFAWRVPVAAAAALVLLLGGAAWLDWPRGASAPAQESLLQPSDPAVTTAEQQYEEAIAGLQQIADARDDELDAGTRAVLRQSLAVIDQAISESRAALSTEPANALVQESLLDALETKVALLQDTVALAGDIAGESLDDASGATREINQ